MNASPAILSARSDFMADPIRLAGAILVGALIVATACATPALSSGTSREARDSGPRVDPQPRYERVDHFWWLVRDMSAAEALFRDTLGFTLGGDVDYAWANLRHIWFGDGSFLELVSPREGTRSLGEAVAAFLRVHEGAWKMAVHVDDAAAVARDLSGRGLTVSEPGGGTWDGFDGRSNLPAEMWRSVDLHSAPGHLLYFWHFTEGWDTMRSRMPDLDPLRPEGVTHANTALGLRTPWLATWDLERTAREFAFLGREAGPTFDVPYLRATGRWLQMDRGRILLLQPLNRVSPVMQFLFVRGEGVIGASIEVRDLDHARRLIESRTGQHLSDYDGLEGRSMMLPATLTRGVMLELFER